MVELRMKIGRNHQEKIFFAVTNLQSHEIFLGYDWLQQHNPEVDWKEGIIRLSRCPVGCRTVQEIRKSEISMNIKIEENKRRKRNTGQR